MTSVHEKKKRAGGMAQGSKAPPSASPPQTTVPQAWGQASAASPAQPGRPGAHRADDEAAGWVGRALPGEQSPRHALLTPRADKRSLRGCRKPRAPCPHSVGKVRPPRPRAERTGSQWDLAHPCRGPPRPLSRAPTNYPRPPLPCRPFRVPQPPPAPNNGLSTPPSPPSRGRDPGPRGTRQRDPRAHLPPAARGAAPLARGLLFPSLPVRGHRRAFAFGKHGLQRRGRRARRRRRYRPVSRAALLPAPSRHSPARSHSARRAPSLPGAGSALFPAVKASAPAAAPSPWNSSRAGSA